MKYFKPILSFLKVIFKGITATLLIFIVINIFAYILLPFLPGRSRDLATFLANDPSCISKDLYQEMPPEYVVDVLEDLITYLNRGCSYFPHSEYCETPFSSKTLNILTDPTGVSYRAGWDEAFTKPDSTAFRIYIFGGSTSMGIFVGDKETWPAQLQKTLNTGKQKVEIINYAVTGHSVTEEFLRFYDLVKLGHRPSMVIVLDGLNLGLKNDQSRFSQGFYTRIRAAQQGQELKTNIQAFLGALPITKLIIRVSPVKVLTYFFIKSNDRDVTISPLEQNSDKNAIRYHTNRFKTGISDFKYLCDRHDIKLLYFLQPNAFYNYNIDSCQPCNKFANPDYRTDLSKIYAGIKKAQPDVIDLTGLFDKYHHRAIVDDSHYSVDFNAYLANEVARFIKMDSLKTAFIDSAAATGEPFTLFTPKSR